MEEAAEQEGHAGLLEETSLASNGVDNFVALGAEQSEISNADSSVASATLVDASGFVSRQPTLPQLLSGGPARDGGSQQPSEEVDDENKDQAPGDGTTAVEEPDPEELERELERASQTEIAGDKVFRLAEAAFSRTHLPISDWSGAIHDSRDYLKNAKKVYARVTSVLDKKKPQIANLVRELREAAGRLEKEISEGQALRETLKEKKDYVEFIVSLEGEWLLKEELFGKGSEEVQDHVEEMILEFNSIATRLISVMSPKGLDLHCRDAYDFLRRAELLTGAGCDNSIQDDERRNRLRSITLNNLGLFYGVRHKLLPALKYLDQALRLELRLKSVEAPWSTHLNLCKVLSELRRHQQAYEHALCAIHILENRLRAAEKKKNEDGEDDEDPHARDERISKMRGDLGNLATANYNAASQREMYRPATEVVDLYRKAYEAAKMAWGSSGPWVGRFREDCERAEERASRFAQTQPSARLRATLQAKGQRSPVPTLGAIPYGFGYVAGDTTVVAGKRAGVPFGFVTTTQPKPKRRPHPISLGSYTKDEMLEMFATDEDRMRTAAYKEGIAKHKETMRTQELEKSSRVRDTSMHEEELQDRCRTGRSSVTPNPRPSRLDPLVLKDEARVDGFWIHGEDGMAYHLIEVARVREDGDGELRWVEGGHAGLMARGASWHATREPLIEPIVGMSGELPPLEAAHALEPERVQHLEEVSSFLYKKLGFAKEQMVQLSVRFVEEKHWNELDAEDRSRNWKETRVLSQKYIVTPKNPWDKIAHIPKTDARLLSVALTTTEPALRTLLSEEFAVELASLQIRYKDVAGDVYNVKTQAGLDAALGESVRLRHKCELLCTGKSLLEDKEKEEEGRKEDLEATSSSWREDEMWERGREEERQGSARDHEGAGARSGGSGRAFSSEEEHEQAQEQEQEGGGARGRAEERGSGPGGAEQGGEDGVRAAAGEGATEALASTQPDSDPNFSLPEVVSRGQELGRPMSQPEAGLASLKQDQALSDADVDV